MSKEDFFGFVGAMMCGLVGWYDEAWRYFWFGSGILLSVWTLWSLRKSAK